MIAKKPGPDLIRAGYRFSEISCSKHNLERDGDSKKSHLALVGRSVTRIATDETEQRRDRTRPCLPFASRDFAGGCLQGVAVASDGISMSIASVDTDWPRSIRTCTLSGSTEMCLPI